MKTRRNIKHKRMATNKYKRMATNKYKRSQYKRSQYKRSQYKRSQYKRSQYKRSAKKAKHTKKRVRFTTRKMRGGYVDLIKMKPYPRSFTILEKLIQKNYFKKCSKEINEICKEIQGFIDYKYLPVKEREELREKFNEKKDSLLVIINKAQLFLNNLEHKENNKEIIDLTNRQHHAENLLNTFMDCYSRYTHVEVLKDSAGKPQNLKRSVTKSSSLKTRTPYENVSSARSFKDSLEGVEDDPMFQFDMPPSYQSSSSQSSNKSGKSLTDSDERTNRRLGEMRKKWMQEPAERIEEDPLQIENQGPDPEKLPQRRNVIRNKESPKAEGPPKAEGSPKAEEPRRKLVRGNVKKVPVLPEFAAAQEAITELDLFLEDEQAKIDAIIKERKKKEEEAAAAAAAKAKAAE